MPSPAPTVAPSPTPSPTPRPGARLHLAAWDGARWRADPPLREGAFEEGEAVPFLLRIDRIRPGDEIPLSITYDCDGFAALTSYDRDSGTAPALAEGGPGVALADAAILVPDGTGAGARLRLWGGLFAGGVAVQPPGECETEKEVALRLRAASGTLYLMWGAEVAAGAASAQAPLTLLLTAPSPSGPFEVTFQILPSAVVPGGP